MRRNSDKIIMATLGMAVLWHGLIEMPLEPNWANRIPYPSLIENYSTYSLIAYLIPGAFLFSAGFYVWLRKFTSSNEDYESAKAVVWIFLVLLVFAMVHAIVWASNLMLNIAHASLIIGLILLPFVLAALALMVIYRLTLPAAVEGDDAS